MFSLLGKESDDSLSPDFIPSVVCYKSSQQKKKKAELALHRYQKWHGTKEKMAVNQKRHVADQGLHFLASTSTQPSIAATSSEVFQDNPDDGNTSDSDTCSVTSGMLDYDIVEGAKDNASLEQECQDLRSQLAESKKIMKNLSVTDDS